VDHVEEQVIEYAQNVEGQANRAPILYSVVLVMGQERLRVHSVVGQHT